jgi:hypothetical protein
MLDEVPDPVWNTSTGNWSVLSGRDRIRCGGDLPAPLGVELAEPGVRTGAGGLDPGEPLDHAGGHRLARDAEVGDRLRGLGTPQPARRPVVVHCSTVPRSALVVESCSQCCNVHYMTTPAHDDQARIEAWFGGRLPSEWTTAAPADVTVDREEIHVILTLESPTPTVDTDTDTVARREAIEGRIAGFRDRTKDERIGIAREAEHRYDRKVAWGVRIGDHTQLFTHLAVPVMTRLRQPERIVLDTLVASGVARSRSDALAWCVRLVGRNTGTWLDDLRRAMEDVERIRAAGPT